MIAKNSSITNQIKTFVAITLFAALFLTTSFCSTDKAEALSSAQSSFVNSRQSNALISDADFIDINSMSVNDIQTFLVNHSSYLAAYTDGSAAGQNRSAAQIIYDAAHGLYQAAGTYNGIVINASTGTVSPRVILTFLQKEQSLIDNPVGLNTSWALTAAVGFACYSGVSGDNNGNNCADAYEGFANQVENGAWQLRYAYERALGHEQMFCNNQPGQTCDYQVGQTITTQDGYSVYLSNRATASIYRYTPYAFNSSFNVWNIFHNVYFLNTTPPPISQGIQVNYLAHVQNVGWMNWQNNGDIAGTTGQSLRVEAVRLTLSGAPADMGIEYRVQVQNIGWMDWVSNGAIAGTTGLGLRIEAIQIKLDNPNSYHISYRSHVQNVGWMSDAIDGATSGTVGQGLRMESLRVGIYSDGNVDPLSFDLLTRGYIQNRGWTSWGGTGDNIGTTGSGLRLEAVQIELVGLPSGANIQYRVHVQSIGWMDWVYGGQTAGTTGQSLRIEAVQIQLVNTPGLHANYQSHIQNIGWMPTVSDGITSGTEGQGLRMEALKISVK